MAQMKGIDASRLATSDRDRFLEKVRTDGTCWVWIRARSDVGYGHFSYRGKAVLAHRWAYEHLVGPIPNGFELDHLCRNRACVNLEHLEPVTRQINMLRGETIAARHAAATHCPLGHPYDDANTYVDPKYGHRHCRECRRAVARSRARQAKERRAVARKAVSV